MDYEKTFVIHISKALCPVALAAIEINDGCDKIVNAAYTKVLHVFYYYDLRILDEKYFSFADAGDRALRIFSYKSPAPEKVNWWFSRRYAVAGLYT